MLTGKSFYVRLDRPDPDGPLAWPVDLTKVHYRSLISLDRGFRLRVFGRVLSLGIYWDSPPIEEVPPGERYYRKQLWPRTGRVQIHEGSLIDEQETREEFELYEKLKGRM